MGRDKSPVRMIRRKADLEKDLENALFYFQLWLDHILLHKVRNLEKWTKSGRSYRQCFQDIVTYCWKSKTMIPKQEQHLKILALLTIALDVEYEFCLFYLCFLCKFLKRELNKERFYFEVAKMAHHIPLSVRTVYKILKYPAMLKLINLSKNNTFHEVLLLIEHDETDQNTKPFDWVEMGIDYDIKLGLDSLPWHDEDDGLGILQYIDNVRDILIEEDIHLNELPFLQLFVIVLFCVRVVPSWLTSLVQLAQNAMSQDMVKLDELLEIHVVYNQFVSLCHTFSYRKLTAQFSQDFHSYVQGAALPLDWKPKWGE